MELTASDGAAGDRFGVSVAVDGDTAVVGASQDDSNKGAAYVLTRRSGRWSQVAKLTASDGVAGDYFGISVAVDGDTVVVGAYLADHDISEGNVDSAYVFTKPGTGWRSSTETTKLTSSDRAIDDWFGFSVAVDGNTAVVGAWGDDDGVRGVNSGSAYVFTRESDSWSQVAKLTASDGVAGDWLGTSVAIDGDTVVAGAFLADGDVGGADEGAAYVFTKPVEGWGAANETGKLTASDAVARGRLGISASVDGTTVVIGADFDDDAGAGSGSAYVFVKPGSGWETATETAKLTSSDAAAGDRFGYAVAVAGTTMTIGAFHDDDGGTESGSVYVYTQPSSGWVTDTETFKLGASDGESYDNFGAAVAVSGGTVVVGARSGGTGDIDSGSAYVYTETVSWTGIPNSGNDEANATSYSVTGLTNFTGYDFSLRAVNSAGNSRASRAVAVTPVGPPVKPTGFSLDQATFDEVPLVWDISIENTILRYEYQRRDRGGSFGSWIQATTFSASLGKSGTRVGDLVNYQEYDFRIRSINDHGAGPASDSVTGGLLDPLQRVSGLTATAGFGSVTLAWTDPQNDAVDGYEYQAIPRFDFLNDDDDVGLVLWDTNTGVVSRSTNPSEDLVPGTEYQIRIRIRSYSQILGVKHVGDWSDTVRVVAWPAKPPTFVAVPGDEELILIWDDPGADIITGYQYTDDGGSNWHKIPGSDATTTSYTVVGLTNGVASTFQIRWKVGEELGVPSDPATGTPTYYDELLLAAGMGVGHVHLHEDWLGFSALYSSVNPDGSLTQRTFSYGSTEYEIEQLWRFADGVGGLRLRADRHIPEDLYQVMTLHVNDRQFAFQDALELPDDTVHIYYWPFTHFDWGLGDAVAVALTVHYVPSAPAMLSAMSGDEQVTLTWATGPSILPITSYQFQEDGSVRGWQDIPDSDASTTSHTAAGLNNGETYTFRVRAVSQAGSGKASDPVSVTPVGPVTISVDNVNSLVGGAQFMHAVLADSSQPDEAAYQASSYQWERKFGEEWREVGPEPATKRVIFHFVETATYRVAVTLTTGRVVRSGPITLTWRLPHVSVTPSDRTPVIGHAITVSADVESGGAGASSYQWERRSGEDWREVGPDAATKRLIFHFGETATYRVAVTLTTGQEIRAEPITLT